MKDKPSTTKDCWFGPTRRGDHMTPERPYNLTWDVDTATNRVELVQISRGGGSTTWSIDGLLHRSDGPAVEYTDGSREWWRYGKLHRSDGPAVFRHPSTGRTPHEWWLNGKRHRIGGPAIEWSPTWHEYYVHGLRYKEDEYYRFVDQLTGEVLLPPGQLMIKKLYPIGYSLT